MNTYCRYEIVKVFRKYGIPYSYNENMDIMYRGFRVQFNTYKDYIFFALPMDKFVKSKKFGYLYRIEEYKNKIIHIKTMLTPHNFRKRMSLVDRDLENANELYSKYENMYLEKKARLQMQIGLLKKTGWVVKRRYHGTNDWEIRMGLVSMFSEDMETIYDIEIRSLTEAGAPFLVAQIFEILGESLKIFINKQKLNKEIDAWITTKIGDKNGILATNN